MSNTKKLRQYLLNGWIFGLAYFGVGVSWVFISIHEYGHSPIWLASLLTFLFVLVLSLFFVVQLGLFFSLQKRFHYFLMRSFSFAWLWMLAEFIRSYLFTGFPWLLLGHSQTIGPFSGYLPILGLYGTGFLCVFSGTLLAETWNAQYKRSIKLLLGLLFIFLLGYALKHIAWTQPQKEAAFKVTFVQGNIPQDEKWSPAFLHTTLQRYTQLMQAAPASRLIIWPEAAIPLLDVEAGSFLEQMSKWAKSRHVSILTGIPLYDQKNNFYYNGAVLVGRDQGQYRKHYLVPFGEYIPFMEWLGKILEVFALPVSSMSAGDKHQPLMKLGQLSFANFICYEIAYPSAVRAALKKANFFVTLTNDAWFGRSFAPAQHTQIAQAQAIISGRPIAFVSNTGITAFIDAQGIIRDSLPIFTTAALHTTLTPYTGYTPWFYWGDWGVILVLSITFIASIFLFSFNSKKKF